MHGPLFFTIKEIGILLLQFEMKRKTKIISKNNRATTRTNPSTLPLSPKK